MSCFNEYGGYRKAAGTLESYRFKNASKSLQSRLNARELSLVDRLIWNPMQRYDEHYGGCNFFEQKMKKIFQVDKNGLHDDC